MAYLSAGDAPRLLRALDPDVPHVVVELHGTGQEWQDIDVPLALSTQPVRRTIRFLSYDLLLSPSEAERDAEVLGGANHGSLTCWQGHQLPPVGWRLDYANTSARRAAMSGLRVTLAIELPHGGEVAQVCSPDEAPLREFLERLSGG